MARDFVCEICVVDKELCQVVRNNLASTHCDYCNRTSDHLIACEFDAIIDRVRFAIDQEYGSPDEETVYDSEEGDYHGDVLYHTELFWEFDFPIENMDLYDDIVDCFSDERFCRKGMLAGSASERQMDAWHGFKEIVKHQRRYTFWTMNEADYYISEHPPSTIVRNIGRTINKFDLVKYLKAGTKFWRVRVHDKVKRFTQAVELAAPNSDQALYANRMSPAGVSMFYGADELETAIRETVEPERATGMYVTGCCFKNVRQFVILDLFDLPVYNFFSDWHEDQREGIAFLRAFQKDISMPVKKDGRQHVDYVPTQVFTEYVRYELSSGAGEDFDGIRFRSSKDSMGCYVLFCDQDDCLPGAGSRGHEQLLEFDKISLQRIDLEKWWKSHGKGTS